MKALLVVLALVACDEHGKSPTVACGDMECAGTELCVITSGGVDAGAAVPADCVAIPRNCDVSGCHNGTCPVCILDLCGGADGSVTLSQRTLRCASQ